MFDFWLGFEKPDSSPLIFWKTGHFLLDMSLVSTREKHPLDQTLAHTICLELCSRHINTMHAFKRKKNLPPGNRTRLSRVGGRCLTNWAIWQMMKFVRIFGLIYRVDIIMLLLASALTIINDVNDINCINENVNDSYWSLR